MRGFPGAGRGGFRGWRRGRGLALGCSLLVLAASASAAVGAASTASVASARERVSRLEADEAHRTLTSGYVTRAKIALDRASKLRASGDEADAVVAERGAGTWLDAAETLARTVDEETAAASLELGALDAGARADRERALLEEALGNAGRRRAELARIERERSSSAPKVRTADIDGGVGGVGGIGKGLGTAPTPGSSSKAFAAGTRDGGLELHMPGSSGAGGASGTKRSGSGTPSEESPP